MRATVHSNDLTDKTDRQTDRQKYRQTDIQTERQTGQTTETSACLDRMTSKTDRLTDRKTDLVWIEGQTDRRVGGEKDRRNDFKETDPLSRTVDSQERHINGTFLVNTQLCRSVRQLDRTMNSRFRLCKKKSEPHRCMRQCQLQAEMHN